MKIPAKEIRDQDVESIINKLGLDAIDPARMEFIKCLDTVDVSACPGSGKTTLVVAKLLLLMEKWQSFSQGICVLSHTNVAKDEVVARLNQNGKSYDINGHPHFVGTVHSFISRYITTPFLASMGFPPQIIDDDFAFSWRENNVGGFGERFFKTRKYNSIRDIKFVEVNRKEPFGETLVNQSQSFKTCTATYGEFANTFWRSIELGILTYDEVLVFAEKALEICPEIGVAIRKRFPFVVLDEAQDCSAVQLNLLHTIFEMGDYSSVVQRIGDPNQAIYSKGNAETLVLRNEAEAFPKTNFLTISDSRRLNRQIASVANLLAVNKIDGGLQGKRDNGILIPPHFIVYDLDNIKEVLPKFTEIVSNCIPQEVLAEQGKISAVGLRVRGDKGKKIPFSVRDYNPNFWAEAQRQRLPKLNCFADYVSFALTVIARSNDFSDGVEILATGVFGILEKVNSSQLKVNSESGGYQKLTTWLDEKEIGSASIKKNFAILLCGRGAVNNYDADDMVESTLALISEEHSCRLREEIEDFYRLNSADVDIMSNTVYESSKRFEQSSNLYSNNGINVQLSSIHAVKGETHTALLLLETFTRTFFVQSLLKKIANKSRKASEAEKQRFRQGFVAFTRPTHLLAVAAPLASLGKNDSEIKKMIEQLQGQGWVIDKTLCYPDGE